MSLTSSSLLWFNQGFNSNNTTQKIKLKFLLARRQLKTQSGRLDLNSSHSFSLIEWEYSQTSGFMEASIDRFTRNLRLLFFHVEDDSEMIDKITEEISKKVMSAKPRRSGSKLEGIDTHMEAIRQKLDLKSNKSVRMFGIWARGGSGRSALAKFVYENISQHFQCHCFLENVKNISQDRHMPHIRRELLKKIQGGYSSTLRLKNQMEVLLVADDVNKVEQIEALAEEFNNFGQGSVVIITTQDKQLLDSANIKLVYEVDLLKFQNVGDLFRQLAFKERVNEFFRQSAFKERHDSAAFESDVEICCSPRDEFIMKNCWTSLPAQ